MLPGMLSTYGKNKQVKLEYKVEDFGDFRSRFAKPYMIATATVNLRFWVVTAPNTEELAVELNLYNITNKVFINEKPELRMSLMIGEFRLHGVEVVESQIGMLNPNTIRLKLNTVNSVIVTLTNIILKDFEVQMPNKILGGLFDLKQLHLEYFDGYIYAGVTPVYVQPPLPAPKSTQSSPAANFLYEDEEEENGYYSRHHYTPHHETRYTHHLEGPVRYHPAAEDYDYEYYHREEPIWYGGHDFRFIQD